MIINVKLSLNIGVGQGRRETDTLEVPDNWRELSADQQQEYLDDMWEGWSSNYIDGHAEEAEDE